MNPTATGPAPLPAPGWITRWQTSLDRFVPSNLVDADVRRRAALFITFSVQGVVFGLAFAGFYLFIGHYWGAAVVFICTAAMGSAPWIVRSAGLERAGNVYAGVLVFGFTALTAMEGGLHRARRGVVGGSAFVRLHPGGSGHGTTVVRDLPDDHGGVLRAGSRGNPTDTVVCAALGRRGNLGGIPEPDGVHGDHRHLLRAGGGGILWRSCAPHWTHWPVQTRGSPT